MSSSLFLCSSGVRHASFPAPLRQPGRHAARLPPATAAFVSPTLRRSPPLHWTGSGVRIISSCFVPKRRRRRNGIYASLFGVGAPEALVIGVVALLVFGPKGLAEVARNLGKTLRAFQPTIRELQDVSRDFRSTLEREIGLDEDPPSTSYRPPPTNNTSQQPAANPPTNSSQQPAADPLTNTSQQPAADPVLDVEPETTVPYTSDELMKVTQQQLAASAIAAWNAKQAEEEEAAAATTPSQSSEAAVATTPSQSSEAAFSGESDGPGAVTEELNSSNTENAKPRDEA